jgi:hypothetical protein
VDLEMIEAIGRLLDPAASLLLELLRLSGLRRIQHRDGWIPVTQALAERVGIADRDRRCRIVKRLRAAGILEVRQLNTCGNKVEYRLNPNWAKREAEVIDLAAVRKAQTAKRVRKS